MVGSDIVKCIKEFHCSASLPKAMLSSFIALIPKSENPQDLDEYRSICLIGRVYKVISKILDARLIKIIRRLISKMQIALIRWRQLLNGVVVANELLNFGKRKKMSCLFFKVDFYKAYNCVDWYFLEKVLLAMGFGDKWIQ